MSLPLYLNDGLARFRIFNNLRVFLWIWEGTALFVLALQM